MSVPQPDSAGVVVVPPVVFALCLIGGIAGAYFIGGTLTAVPEPMRWAAGLLVFVAGGVFGFSGFFRFRHLDVDVRPTKPAAKLVGGGAYRVTRNPMYVGLVCALTGIGLFFGSIPMLLGAVVMFAYLNWYVIPREEAYLTRTFGDDYRAYRAKVRRWL